MIGSSRQPARYRPAAGPVAQPRSVYSRNVRLAQLLTAAIVPLAAVASAGGLLIPGLYHNPAAIVPAMQGQDAITLLVLPLLSVALLAARRGSARATLVWIGLLGYIWYTYTGAAFAYYFNAFLLLYIALFSMSALALIAACSGIDVAAVERRFDSSTPRWPVIGFLLLLALMLGGLELGQNIQFLITGAVPENVLAAGGTTYFVYVMDLGIVVPLALLAAIWLWRQRPWGGVLAGSLLIKSAAMGFALLAMNWFNVRAGQPADGLELLWAGIAFGGLGLSAWFFRHCRG